jgi:DNA-binding SARP family transcriptional activator/WD40 repeat protein
MRVALLGPFELDTGAPVGPRDRVVLSVLVLRRGRTVGAEVLADALWPDEQPVSWPKVVQGCVSRLRRMLGAEAIETNPAGYRLRTEGIWFDGDEFEDLVARGRGFAEEDSPERAAALLKRALDLWRGRPFDALEEWSPGRLEAARLSELRLAVQEERLAARLAAGHHVEVAAEGTVLVGEEPWRERRWAILALAQYRSGRQAESLATIRAARRRLGSQHGLDLGPDLVELERAILGQDPSLAADHDARQASSECPWRGLASYEAEDRETFFGRDVEVEACLARLDASPLLVLAGPSGSGKSSLMKAGVAPALRLSGHTVVTFSPGTDPAAAMGAARASVAGDPVLCVDQFEEAFAGGEDRTAVVAWLGEVTEYAEHRAPVIVTVRADYLPEFALESGFARLAERGLYLVAPLAGDSLRAAIEGPARVAGVRLGQGLVDLLMRDAENQPGALPLLSHALAETWTRREGSLLTVDGYQESGGISGAVAASADRLHQSLSDDGRTQLRWLMLRMGSLAEHGEPVRTPVSHDVASGDPERARVLDLLVRSRLVISNQGSFDLAHEALIRAWPRLRGWLEEDREGQRLWRHLAAASAEWDGLGRPPSELYSGVRLEAARQWASQPTALPTPLEQDFLDASLARAAADREELARQARQERRQNRRLRGLLAGAAAMLALALVAALLAVDQGRTAADQRDAARAARRTAQHESLVGRSLTLRSTKRAAAALLAVEAYLASPDALSESALLGTFTEAPGFMGYRTVPYYVVQGDAVPGTHTAVLASGSRIHVVDLATGELGPAFDHPMTSDKSLTSVLHVSADGSRVAQLMFAPRELDRCGTYEVLEEDNGRGCTLLTVFDVASGARVLGPVSTPFSGGDVAIDAGGSMVAVTGGLNGDLATYDVESGRLVGRLAGLPRPDDAASIRDTGAVRFDRSGHVYLGSMRGPMRRVDARSLEVVETIPAPEQATHNFLELTSDGLLVGAGDSGMVAIDTHTGRSVWEVDFSANPDLWPCFSFAVAEEMGRAYCGSQYGEIEERDLRNGQLTGFRLDSQLGEVGDLTVAGGNELVEFSRGYHYRWRLDGSGPVSELIAPGSMSVAGYDPFGRYLVVSPRGKVRPQEIWDRRTGRRVASIDLDADAAWVAPGVLYLRSRRGSLLVDAATGRRWHPASEVVDQAERFFPGRDGVHAWAATASPQGRDDERRESFDVHEFEVATGTVTGRSFSVPGYVYQVAEASDRRSVWVNYYGEGGSWLAHEDEFSNTGVVVDLESRTVGEELHVATSAVSGRDGLGRLVGSDYRGEIREYDPDTREPVATIPGARGFVTGLAFSSDGQRLVSSVADGSVLLYDTDAWTRLGAIPVESPGIQEGWLRPDGRVVAVNGRLGLAEWTLEPDELGAAACRLAGRNLTTTEWTTYMGDEPYRRTCPDYPAGE